MLCAKCHPSNALGAPPELAGLVVDCDAYDPDSILVRYRPEAVIEGLDDLGTAYSVVAGGRGGEAIFSALPSLRKVSRRSPSCWTRGDGKRGNGK